MTGFDDDTDTGQLLPAGTGLLGGGIPAVRQKASVVVQAPVGTTLESIPAPQSPSGDGALAPHEQEALTACKAGMNNLQNAFWVAGKSLETMARGNLHRNEGFTSFADFVWTNWEISEPNMHRLIKAWPIGESLSQLGWRPRESQVRELTELGEQAAVAVYDTVARTGKVTAKILHHVVRQLPALPQPTQPADIQSLVKEILTGPHDEAAAPEDKTPENKQAAPEHPATATSQPSSSSSTASSPIGEPTAGPGAPPPRSPDHDSTGSDLRRMAAAFSDLQAINRRLTKQAVQRATDHDAERAETLRSHIGDALVRIAGTVATGHAAADTARPVDTEPFTQRPHDENEDVIGDRTSSVLPYDDPAAIGQLLDRNLEERHLLELVVTLARYAEGRRKGNLADLLNELADGQNNDVKL
ncbi:hypothetical protein DSC45_34095 [Streptomyces sp. YIM 130001]|uniref:hypothetical protein n=1 Tax=Streptomyces sp. YIM 130001 TaxID=2259644 RepID=UPI000ECEB8F5|nr:hypothetical protein [Streptomyces sp. YIM 130001]RII07948.1 hypothetical protein DSC45_34095 [Streptomyces sp. YIM 130001]